MSFGIYWQPHNPPKGYQLPTGLKYAIGERYMGSTSLRGADAFFDKTYITYLTGLIDGSGNDEVREGARELIRAIEKHGTVRVWIGEDDD
jgi:hypothetical protein